MIFSLQECKRRKYKRVAQPNALNVVEIPLHGDEELLKRIVASKGPVVVVMHVAESIFTYASGGLCGVFIVFMSFWGFKCSLQFYIFQ